MILDATAGNRTMWAFKKPHDVIFIDMERKLEIKPTVFADYRQTPFPDNTFDVIFFDPPHNWGGAIHYFSFPSKKERAEVFKNATGTPTYYGWDKYKSRSALIKSMYLAQVEFRRILKPDGIMWFKWNEMRIPINRIMAAFNEWIELMRLYVNDPTHTAGKHQTFWIMLMQKEGRIAQQPLLPYL